MGREPWPDDYSACAMAHSLPAGRFRPPARTRSGDRPPACGPWSKDRSHLASGPSLHLLVH
jgi:hypothetical protein